MTDWDGLDEISTDYTDLQLKIGLDSFTASFIYKDGTNKDVVVSLPRESDPQAMDGIGLLQDDLDLLAQEVTQKMNIEQELLELLQENI